MDIKRPRSKKHAHGRDNPFRKTHSHPVRDLGIELPGSIEFTPGERFYPAPDRAHRLPGLYFRACRITHGDNRRPLDYEAMPEFTSFHFRPPPVWLWPHQARW